MCYRTYFCICFVILLYIALKKEKKKSFDINLALDWYYGIILLTLRLYGIVRILCNAVSGKIWFSNVLKGIAI